MSTGKQVNVELLGVMFQAMLSKYSFQIQIFVEIWIGMIMLTMYFQKFKIQ